MNVPVKFAILLALLSTAVGDGLTLDESAQREAETSPNFCAAHVRPKGASMLLVAFPSGGQQVEIEISQPIANLRAISFSLDGRALYGQKTGVFDVADGIVKIGLTPARRDIVPGSEGLGAIWQLTLPAQSGKMFASGWSKKKGECGAYEIDPQSGGFRTVKTGAYPECGDAGGAVSSDGRRVIGYRAKALTILDLESGAATKVGVGLKRGTWSPDAHWIAAISDANQVILIDPSNSSVKRKLGSSSAGPVVWSPDSKRLLFRKSGLSCAATLYGESLEVVDVVTGVGSEIKNSHCRIAGGMLGWIDQTILSELVHP